MHYWVDLQSVQGFCCYDNIHVCKLIALYTANAYSVECEMSASACTHCMPGWDNSSAGQATAANNSCYTDTRLTASFPRQPG